MSKPDSLNQYWSFYAAERSLGCECCAGKICKEYQNPLRPHQSPEIQRTNRRKNGFMLGDLMVHNGVVVLP